MVKNLMKRCVHLYWQQIINEETPITSLYCRSNKCLYHQNFPSLKRNFSKIMNTVKLIHVEGLEVGVVQLLHNTVLHSSDVVRSAFQRFKSHHVEDEYVFHKILSESIVSPIWWDT